MSTSPNSPDLLARFVAYAQAFEQTYADDDWRRLDAFLAPDVTYRVLGTEGWDCVVEGRDAVYSAIRKFLDGFDRRCTRRVLPGEAPPVVTADSVRVGGLALYKRGDSDELLLDIILITEFRGDMIIGLSDVYPLSNGPRMRAWMERWGAGLDPSYV